MTELELALARLDEFVDYHDSDSARAALERVKQALSAETKLFEVSNGYMGNGCVACVVEASNETEAIERAHNVFAAAPEAARHPDYATRLTAQPFELGKLIEIG